MAAVRHIEIPERLRVVATLARLLQGMEGGDQRVDPTQYRQVAQRLADTLAVTDADENLDALLGVFPSAAMVYENVRYAHAGLCRHGLEESLNTEVQTRELLSRLRAI